MDAIVIQARTKNTRLPGKVLRDIYPGKTFLEFQIQRLKVFPHLQIILAIPDNLEDSVLMEIGERLGVWVIRGPEEDVLGRYYLASKMSPFRNIIRITSDCPFIDPDLIRKAYGIHLMQGCDFTYFSHSDLPRGLADIEIIRASLLQEIHEGKRGFVTDYEREHVTMFIRQRMESFFCQVVSVPPSMRCPEFRLTLDYEEDMIFLQELYKVLKGKMNTENIVETLRRYPRLVEINKARWE